MNKITLNVVSFPLFISSDWFFPFSYLFCWVSFLGQLFQLGLNVQVYKPRLFRILLIKYFFFYSSRFCPRLPWRNAWKPFRGSCAISLAKRILQRPREERKICIRISSSVPAIDRISIRIIFMINWFMIKRSRTLTKERNRRRLLKQHSPSFSLTYFDLRSEGG